MQLGNVNKDAMENVIKDAVGKRCQRCGWKTITDVVINVIKDAT